MGDGSTTSSCSSSSRVNFGPISGHRRRRQPWSTSFRSQGCPRASRASPARPARPASRAPPPKFTCSSRSRARSPRGSARPRSRVRPNPAPVRGVGPRVARVATLTSSRARQRGGEGRPPVRRERGRSSVQGVTFHLERNATRRRCSSNSRRAIETARRQKRWGALGLRARWPVFSWRLEANRKPHQTAEKAPAHAPSARRGRHRPLS